MGSTSMWTTMWTSTPMAETRKPEPRIASHPDDPNAPLATRLMLALGIWPVHAMDVGDNAIVEAAVIIRNQAHRFPMAAEDFGTERGLRDELVGVLREI